MIGRVFLILFLSLVLVALVLLAYHTVKMYILRRKYRHIPGPATKGIIGFYMGNLDLALKVMNDGKIFADWMLELSYQYGEVFKFQILDKIIVFTINPDAVKVNITLIFNYQFNIQKTKSILFNIRTF